MWGRWRVWARVSPYLPPTHPPHPAQVPWLIGKEGAKINEIRDKARVTRLELEEVPGAPKSQPAAVTHRAVITGRADDVATAVALIEAHLDYQDEFRRVQEEEEEARERLRALDISYGEGRGRGGGGGGPGPAYRDAGATGGPAGVGGGGHQSRRRRDDDDNGDSGAGGGGGRSGGPPRGAGGGGPRARTLGDMLPPAAGATTARPQQRR